MGPGSAFPIAAPEAVLNGNGVFARYLHEQPRELTVNGVAKDHNSNDIKTFASLGPRSALHCNLQALPRLLFVAHPVGGLPKKNLHIGAVLAGGICKPFWLTPFGIVFQNVYCGLCPRQVPANWPYGHSTSTWTCKKLAMHSRILNVTWGGPICRRHASSANGKHHASCPGLQPSEGSLAPICCGSG